MDTDRELSRERKTEHKTEKGSKEGKGEAEAHSQVILIGMKTGGISEGEEGEVGERQRKSGEGGKKRVQERKE